MQLWERRSHFVTDSEASLWSDVTPPMMSDEDPMPDGKIARRRLSWRSETFNELMETLDQRANSSFKKSARKERILSTPIDSSPPANIKDWMIQRTEDTDISQWLLLYFVHVVLKSLYKAHEKLYSSTAIIHMLYTCKQCGTLVVSMSILLFYMCYTKDVCSQCPQAYSWCV